MTDPITTDDAGAMGQIREDMEVLDPDGEKIGTVKVVKIGDPEAATAVGQTVNTEANSIIGDLGETVGATEPELPAPLAERLLREGFIRIDSKGLFRYDVYASSRQIDRVEGDTVHLAVGKDQLATRGQH